MYQLIAAGQTTLEHHHLQLSSSISLTLKFRFVSSVCCVRPLSLSLPSAITSQFKLGEQSSIICPHKWSLYCCELGGDGG